jgi:uncharacterized protein YkwD
MDVANVRMAAGIVALFLVLACLALFFFFTAELKSAPVKTIAHDYTTTLEDSRALVDAVNRLRVSEGLGPVGFSGELYELAEERAGDLITYDYLAHRNPHTGHCAQAERSNFGINGSVAESLFSDPLATNQTAEWVEGNWNDVLGFWMNSAEERANLLFAGHTHAAVACNLGKCVFLGLNDEGYTTGCE